jgi:DNA-binding transcriptional MerR regulator
LRIDKLAYIKSEAKVKILELVTRESLPHRNFFRASEVSELLAIKPHEIRYWETEFPQIRPQKSKTGQRIYRRHDLILFFAIKHFLQEKKMTLPAVQRIITESDEIFVTQQESAPKEGGGITPDACGNGSEPCIDTREDHSEANLAEQNVSLLHESKSLESLENQVLEEASQLLDSLDTDEFDQMTHQIYQECAVALDDASVEFEPHQVGEMLRDAIDQQSAPKNRWVSQLEYKKTMAALIESKNSLTDVLLSLEKFHESDFWQGFKQAGQKTDLNS